MSVRVDRSVVALACASIIAVLAATAILFDHWLSPGSPVLAITDEQLRNEIWDDYQAFVQVLEVSPYHDYVVISIHPLTEWFGREALLEERLEQRYGVDFRVREYQVRRLNQLDGLDQASWLPRVRGANSGWIENGESGILLRTGRCVFLANDLGAIPLVFPGSPLVATWDEARDELLFLGERYPVGTVMGFTGSYIEDSESLAVRPDPSCGFSTLLIASAVNPGTERPTPEAR